MLPACRAVHPRKSTPILQVWRHWRGLDGMVVSGKALVISVGVFQKSGIMLYSLTSIDPEIGKTSYR